MQFPTKAKFLPLRRVVLTREHASFSTTRFGNLWLCGIDNIAALSKSVVECDVVLLDSRHHASISLREKLKSVSKVPVAYLPCASLTGMVSSDHVLAAAQKLEQLAYSGWQFVELSFGPSASAYYIDAVIKKAKDLGLAVCVYVDKSLEALANDYQAWNTDAASCDEVRATKSVSVFRPWLVKRLPVYSLEFGSPNNPGKSQLDLKSFAIRHRISVTLTGKDYTFNARHPSFHFHVTY